MKLDELLIEESESPALAELTFHLTLKANVEDQRKCIDVLRELLGKRVSYKCKISGNYMQRHLYIIIYNVGPEVYASRSAVSSFIHSLEIITLDMLKLAHEVNQIIPGTSTLQAKFYAMPSSPVAVKNITLECSPLSLYSLEGVDRIFKDSENVLLKNYLDLRTHVLGLLRLREVSFSLTPDVANRPQPAWAKILTHAVTNKLDILSTQEELIDAGFEDHAQL